MKLGIEIPDNGQVDKWVKEVIGALKQSRNVEIVSSRMRLPFADHGYCGILKTVQTKMFLAALSKSHLENMMEKTKIKVKDLPDQNDGADCFLAFGTTVNYTAEELKCGVLRILVDGEYIEKWSAGVGCYDENAGITISAVLITSEGIFNVVSAKIKVARLFFVTRNNIDYKMANFVLYALLHLEMKKNFEQRSINFGRKNSCLKIEWKLMVSLARGALRTFIRQEKRKWDIYCGGLHDLGHILDVQLWKKLSAPKGKWWADPIGFEYGREQIVFVEEYSQEERKGAISALKINDGEADRLGIAIKEDYHMSFPFVFEYEGGIYMIPETSRNQTVNLYACEEFPLKWKLKKYIFEDFHACDTAVFERSGTWWLFTSVKANGWSQDEQLYLFHTDNPVDGIWIPHRMNPIVLGADRARMAGRIIETDGKLYRPAQDCVRYYGDAIHLYEITSLTSELYEEKEICSFVVEPKQGLGVHTLCKIKNDIIIDVQTGDDW